MRLPDVVDGSSIVNASAPGMLDTFALVPPDKPFESVATKADAFVAASADW